MPSPIRRMIFLGAFPFFFFSVGLPVHKAGTRIPNNRMLTIYFLMDLVLMPQKYETNHNHLPAVFYALVNSIVNMPAIFAMQIVYSL